MPGQIYIPERMEMDVQETFTQANAARYIKNLIYSMGDTSEATVNMGGRTGVYKPMESNAVYVDDFVLPAGTIQVSGRACFRKTRQAFIWTYSALGNHAIFRINGDTATIDTVYIRSTLNLQLDPRYFINGDGGCWLEEMWVADPNTGAKVRRSFLFFTDAYNDQGFICVEDAVATGGFDANKYPFFAGVYDQRLLIRMGTMTPNDCIKVDEVQLDQNTAQLANNLIYNTWQFRVRYIDVWGRPSEYGIMSDMYIPGGGGCIQASTNLPRCLNLTFNAPPPHINQVEIAYRKCNSTQWYLADTLDLYVGTPLGQWWMRKRNPDVVYISGTITYNFCANEGSDPIDPTLTNRVYNPLPRISTSVAKIGSFIGLGGNENGFLPWSQDLLEKFSITITPPGQTTNGARSAEIYVEIFNPFGNSNEPIYQGKLGNTSYFGFGSYVINPAAQVFTDYKQYFINPNQEGFVGYLAGTGAYVISQQYVMDVNGNFTPVTAGQSVEPSGIGGLQRYFQKFTFTNLSPQTYVFRISDHQTDPVVTPTYQQTSTYLRGSFSCNFQAPSSSFSQVNHNSVTSSAKELVIDLCDGNYSTLTDNKILVIYDLSGSTARAGYVKNTNEVGVTPIGIELLKVGFTSPANICSQFTDHNGFFFCASTSGGQGSQYNISGYCGCKPTSFTGGIDIGSNGGLQIDDWPLNNNSNCPKYDDPTLGECNYITITGQVLIANSTVGVPNIGVVLARGGIATTDNNGSFTIIAHDDSTVPGPRLDEIYIIGSSCSFTDATGNCIAPVPVFIIKCISCIVRTVVLKPIYVLYVSLKGLLSGGTYLISAIPWDWAGRPGFSQQLGSVTMPSVYETHVFAPSTLGIQIASDAVLPADVAYITFSVSAETSIEDYVDWIVDSFEFVDNTGLENTVAPTQIKIYYASLIEYNKQNNYNTTVNWSFLETLPNVTNQTPVTTDKVQFLMNGDGTFFDQNIVSLVKYDQTGQYFLINYTPALSGLVANARIRIFRPTVSEFSATTDNTNPYFEVCSTILVNNGVPVSFSAILNAFDTYYIYRGVIPVPTAQPNTSPISYVDEPRLEGLPFEHNSPSDFWGQGCANYGRISVNNDQETIVFSQDQVTLSDAATGQFNLLCFFGEQPIADFSTTGINGIVAMLPETGKVLIIGQDDNFVVGFNDNLVRVNADGSAQAGSVPNSFGQPYIKIGQNWGCRLEDKNTIYKKDGLVHWLDSPKVAVIQHNYSFGLNVSKTDAEKGVPGGVDSWVRSKVKAVQNFNNIKGGFTRYFHGVVNPQSGEYILTDYTIGSKSYVNSERGKNVSVNETMAMNIYTKFWTASYGHTPEMYAEIEGELNAQQLFSFISAIAYSHYNANKTYGQMYGVNLVRVIEPVISVDKMAKKKPLSIGVICKQGQYFVDNAVNEGGQKTRILLAYWIQAVWGWYAPYLCNVNTPYDPNRPKQTKALVLTEGDMMVGNYIKTRLIGDPATDTTYTELEGIVTSVFKDGNNLVNK